MYFKLDNSTTTQVSGASVFAVAHRGLGKAAGEMVYPVMLVFWLPFWRLLECPES